MRDFFKIRPRKNNNCNPAIIAFTNFKGGVAKTTAAIHSAQYFAKSGYKVLLIDSDSQASTTTCFGYTPDEEIKESETLSNFFLGRINSFKSLIKKTYWNGLDLIPANLSIYSIELKLPVIFEKSISSGTPIQLHKLLHDGIQTIKNNYDIIIIDCPPAMSILNTNALYASNSLIIPVPPELPDVASMIQFFNMIYNTLEKFPDKEYNFIKILLTKHDSSITNHSIAEALRHLYGLHIMRAEMSMTQVIKKARAEMSTVYEVEKYKGSKKTLIRACQIIDEVNKEIEFLIKKNWDTEQQNNPSKQ